MNFILKATLIASSLVAVVYYAPIQSDMGVSQATACVTDINKTFEQLFSQENTAPLKELVPQLQKSYAQLVQSISLIEDQDLRDILKKFSLQFKKIIDILLKYVNARPGKFVALLNEIKKECDVRLLFSQAIQEITAVGKKLVQTKSKPLTANAINALLTEMKQISKQWDTKTDPMLIDGIAHLLRLNK